MRYWLILGLAIALTSCQFEETTARIPIREPQMIDHHSTRLADLGRYTKAVKLEAGEDSLVGHVGAVEIDPRNGDILVGDYRAGRRVFRFDSEGSFIRSYGAVGQGPDEYESIHGFTVMDDGRVVILGTLKVLMFSPEGELLTYAKHGIGPHFVKAVGNSIYLYGSRGFREIDEAVMIFDDQLTPLHSFHPYDQRLNQVAIAPFQALAADEDNVYVSEFLDFKLTVYHPSGEPKASYRFPDLNHEIDTLWNTAKREVDKAQRLEIGRGLHNMRSAYAVQGKLFFIEANFKHDIYRPSVLDFQTNTLHRYTRLRPMVNRGTSDYITFREVVGAYDRGVIGLVEDAEQFEASKHLDPITADLTLTDEDNPLLLFFELTNQGDAT